MYKKEGRESMDGEGLVTHNKLLSQSLQDTFFNSLQAVSLSLDLKNFKLLSFTYLLQEFWDVERNGDGSRVRIYINVAFSKNTMWKGRFFIFIPSLVDFEIHEYKYSSDITNDLVWQAV